MKSKPVRVQSLEPEMVKAEMDNNSLLTQNICMISKKNNNANRTKYSLQTHS